MSEENLEKEAQTSTDEGGEEIQGLSLDEKNTEETKDEVNDETKDDVQEAPEEYDFSAVELPEGVELDKDLTSEFSQLAKEHNLSNDNASKFMAIGVKLSTQIKERFEQAVKEAHENQLNAYKTMLNTDSEIGGAKLKQSLLDANVAYNEFVSPEAAKLLSDTGLNNHPAIVKVFMNIGKQLKDDAIRQTGDSRKERTALDWYPEMETK